MVVLTIKKKSNMKIMSGKEAVEISGVLLCGFRFNCFIILGIIDEQFLRMVLLQISAMDKLT